MIKLYRARLLLYRRQILQENIRWKALDEIYKMYMLLHRSDLNISEKNRRTFSHVSETFANLHKFTHFRKKINWILLGVRWNVIGISQIFSKMLKNPEFVQFSSKMDCGVYYHEAQSGKSKRENRENNGHLVRKTFTPNKQTTNRIQILLQ